MLGGDDDLAAVLSVLDQLAKQLGANREALDKTCAAADELSGEAAPHTEAIAQPDAGTLAELEQERQECELVRTGLDYAVQKVVESKTLLEEMLEKHMRHELDFRCQASQELLSWRERVGAAHDEFHELKSQNLGIDAKLVDLYKRLQDSPLSTASTAHS